MGTSLGPARDAIVIGWAVATLGALVVSIHCLQDDELWQTRAARRLTNIGLASGLFSVAALVLAGVAFAAGINPTGVCGSG